MRAVDIEALKGKLSEYVRLAESGEIVLVTDRDRVIAELRPPEPGRALDPADARLADAVRRGVLTRPGSPGGGPPASKAVMRLADLMVALAEDRADR